MMMSDMKLEMSPPGVRIMAPKGTHQSYSSPGNKHAATIPKTQPIQGFRGSGTNGRSAAAVLGAHQRRIGLTDPSYQNITSTNAYGTQYGTQVLWSGHPMYLLVDTGSSDTWAVQENFTCSDYDGEVQTRDACKFGPAFPETFQYGKTDPEQYMFVMYGDGETVSGPMGFSDITLGGNITVTQQQVSLANSTCWHGNNATSGLMGLAFRSLTRAYVDDNSGHWTGSEILYSPLFTSMVSQGKSAPLFSISIDRNSSGGMLTWGGVTPTSGMDDYMMASLDMLIVSTSPCNACWYPNANFLAGQS